ncbi:protein FAM32A [Parachaetomium inaequale]|uniref:Protein FAM32A n=1 Tax=Parachaetomium inaequale TaxID=2588326 RepID=A0AAN6PR91_9PEZI|nr:protein FAM32A [Parachaetomium inaequale]
MPADEYTSIARGPLKLKGGAGVTKKKKKKDKDRAKGAGTDLEKNLSTGSGGDRDSAGSALAVSDDAKNTPDERSPDAEDNKGRRGGSEEGRDAKGEGEGQEEEEENKTETERRFAEAKRKRLKELTESGRIRPELLKTHKQRVEELNAHLARLSEHHDMPKIGPG